MRSVEGRKIRIVLNPPLLDGSLHSFQEQAQRRKRQSDDIPKVAFDAFDKRGSATLRRIRPRLVHRLARRDITRDPLIRNSDEAHRRDVVPA